MLYWFLFAAVAAFIIWYYGLKHRAAPGTLALIVLGGALLLVSALIIVPLLSLEIAWDTDPAFSLKYLLYQYHNEGLGLFLAALTGIAFAGWWSLSTKPDPTDQATLTSLNRQRAGLLVIGLFIGLVTLIEVAPPRALGLIKSVSTPLGSVELQSANETGASAGKITSSSQAHLSREDDAKEGNADFSSSLADIANLSALAAFDDEMIRALALEPLPSSRSTIISFDQPLYSETVTPIVYCLDSVNREIQSRSVMQDLLSDLFVPLRRIVGAEQDTLEASVTTRRYIIDHVVLLVERLRTLSAVVDDVAKSENSSCSKMLPPKPDTVAEEDPAGPSCAASAEKDFRHRFNRLLCGARPIGEPYFAIIAADLANITEGPLEAASILDAWLRANRKYEDGKNFSSLERAVLQWHRHTVVARLIGYLADVPVQNALQQSLLVDEGLSAVKDFELLLGPKLIRQAEEDCSALSREQLIGYFQLAADRNNFAYFVGKGSPKDLVTRGQLALAYAMKNLAVNEECLRKITGAQAVIFLAQNAHTYAVLRLALIDYARSRELKDVDEVKRELVDLLELLEREKAELEQLKASVPSADDREATLSDKWNADQKDTLAHEIDDIIIQI